MTEEGRGYLAEHSTQAPWQKADPGRQDARKPPGAHHIEIPAASAGMTEEGRGYDGGGARV